MDKVETIVSAMAAGAGHPMVQRTQTRFRMDLVEGWGIPAGASVLEIGCGQGDMTAVLADAVGAGGQVVAVDIADPSYGAPVTLGESAAFLKASPLGSRMDIRFGVNVLDEATQFPDDAFDYVVLSHCSWYFASLEQLRRTLDRARPWARRLCFSEWSLQPQCAAQLPHLLAVLIQGQVEAQGARGNGNVRTPFSYESLARSLDAAGWRPTARRDVDTLSMQDADWEVDACLRMIDSSERLEELPRLARDFLASQADVLRAAANRHGNQPLPSYALLAERA
ncbi:SAM-dependent methyltransferase [Streptacidiphilus sp. MAP12-16]|uniref:class I SAM-dependent methyltransferase n=1 Tax=Streptacidiphilus sp. MAP12-16 TaxID=3156300 RepID=UPI003511DF8D